MSCGKVLVAQGGGPAALIKQSLPDVAGKTRTMEDHVIAASSTDITDALRLYLRPLLGSGIADALRLRPHPVPWVLRP